MREVRVELPTNGYDILIGEGLEAEIASFFESGGFSSRALILSDTNVGKLYTEKIAELLKHAGKQPSILLVPAGESSKSLTEAERVYTKAIEVGLDRKSVIVALGGGVVGDLAGFIAATYMRGIPFVQIPTSLLAQVDSSVGGKVAVNHRLGKNMIGAFYQPKRVLIDPEVLETLPDRQVANGMAEAVKMAVCFDAEGFALAEGYRIGDRPDRLIENALRIKKRVVEEDVKEQGLRRALNFGHTLGHGIESLHAENGLYHGECVALGMLPMCSDAVRPRLKTVLERLGLPTVCGADPGRVMAAVIHDKKADHGKIMAVVCEEAGSCRIIPMTPEELRERYTAQFG